ncbi:MAG: S41 family peptidase [Marinilabiliales bacterium]|nr:S41 family peptidase [Marinilabiliales bacterium]
MKKKNIIKATLTFALVVVMGISFWSFKTDQKNFEISKNLDIFYSLFRELNLFYVDDVKPEKLMKKGIDEMLESLDPYTTFIPEEDMDDFKFMTTGEYGGIGALISKRGNSIIVAEPYEGFPAQKAGLKAGDVFLELDGMPVTKATVEEVSAKLKGPAKKTLKLKMQRPGSRKPFEVEIVREEIKIDPVTYAGMLDNKVGYIRMSSFTDGCADRIKESFLELRDKKGATTMVLDLRANPGGLMGEAVKIVNLFVRHGEEVVSTKGKVAQWDKTYRATEQPVDTVMPLVLLVNRGSASASEIVAGALQDLDRAVILGSRTFGKGLVQTTRDLSYNTKLKVTTAKYYIPSGRCIQALDYSHRNKDGSVGTIPDSLIHAFKTKRGRVVYDGGGIVPDVKVDQDTLCELAYKLVQDNIIFDYATEFAAAHPTIATPDQFVIDDAIFEGFHKFLLSKSFKYESRSQQVLKALMETAQRERVYEESKNEFEALGKRLTRDVDADLKKFRKEVSDLLADEIVGRYYYQKGAVVASFRDDLDLEKAKVVLANRKGYDAILQPVAEKKAATK